MTYQEFVENVKEKLAVREELKNVTLSVESRMKNNGFERTGIIFAEKGKEASPLFYMEESFQKYVNGECLDVIIEDIITTWKQVQVEMEKKILSYDLEHYNSIKNSIQYRLINYEKNKDMLNNVPHRKYLNLAVVYVLNLSENDYGMETMLITNKHMTLWKVSLDEIENQAKNSVFNSAERFQMIGLNQLIEERVGIKEPEEYETMYVLTNMYRNYGANVILCQDFMEKVAERLNCDFYAIPSSVHEIILIKWNDAPSKEEMNEMLNEVNRSQVPEDEILGDKVFYYSRKEKKLSIW